MEDRIEFTLKPETIENLEAFSKILDRSFSTIVEEALEHYFVVEQQKLAEKGLADENALTNLDYDEFWEGVDLD
jgi:predicted DNA-binding protein